MTRYRVERVFTEDCKFTGFLNYPSDVTAIRDLKRMALRFARSSDSSYLKLYRDKDLIITLEVPELT